MHKRGLFYSWLTCFSCIVAGFQVSLAQTTRVTVDASGFAIVTETRRFDLKSGVQEIVWDEVSGQLDAASVQLVNADRRGGINVVRQRFEFDLSSRQTLLNRYLGKNITLVRRDQDGRESERLTARLISVEGGKVSLIQLPDGQLRLDPAGEVVLPGLPDGPVLIPRLVFTVNAEDAGSQKLELTYVTRGLSWAANYTLHLNHDATRAALIGWLTLSNGTNVTFKEAVWRLLAEEVRKKDAFQPVDEKVTVEYKPEGLEKPATLSYGDYLRVPLTSADEIAVEQRFVFDPIGSGPAAPTPPQKLRMIARFTNDAEHGLGIPLPGGRVLVMRALVVDDTTQASRIRPVVEASIPATAAGKFFDILLGDAPGIEGERKQTAFRQVTDRTQEQDVEITIRNKTKEPAHVIAVEHPWGNYTIVQKSHEFVKQEDGSIEFSLDVPPGGSTTVTYRIRIAY